MSDADKGQFSSTEPVPMVFPHLIEPVAFKEDGKDKGEPKFSASFVYDPTSADLTAAKAVMKAVALKKWPEVSMKEVTFPVKSGTKLADTRKAKRAAQKKDGADDIGDFIRGKAVIKASSKFAVKLGGIENGRIADYDDPDVIKAKAPKFYQGAETLAEFTFRASEVKGEKFIVAYLNQVMVTGKGTKVGGGGRSRAETFSKYKGAASAEDPTVGSGVDDEIQY